MLKEFAPKSQPGDKINNFDARGTFTQEYTHMTKLSKFLKFQMLIARYSLSGKGRKYGNCFHLFRFFLLIN